MSGPRFTRFVSSPNRPAPLLAAAVIAVLCLGGPSAAWALAYDIMLDASGSMQGFKTDRDPVYQTRWRGILNALESAAGQRFQFGDRDRFREIKASLYEIPLRDDDTYLGDAVQRWVTISSPDKALVVITDNQADTQGPTDSARQQQILEQLLTGATSPFSGVGLVAVRLPFSGLVYSLDDTARQYRGDRALVIYVLGRNAVDLAEYRKVTELVRTALAGYELRQFPIRPFDSAAVASRVDDIVINQTGEQTVRVATENGRIIIEDYPFGEPLRLRFKADIKTTGNALQLKDVALDAALSFDSLPELVNSRDGASEVTHATVRPKCATFSPDEVKGFDIQFEIRSFGFFDLPFTEQLAWTLRDTQKVEGKLELRFRASKDQIQVDPTVLQGWSHEGPGSELGRPDRAIQERVYHLGRLINGLVPDQTSDQTLKTFPVTLEMRFSALPLLMVLFLMAVLVGLTWALIHWLNRDARFLIEDQYLGTQAPIALNLLQRYSYMSGDDRLLFALRFIGVGTWVSTPYVLRSARLIGPGQQIVIYDPESEEEREFRLVEDLENSPINEPDWE